MTTASPFLVWSFVILGLLVAAAFPVGVYLATKSRQAAIRAALGTIVWLGVTLAAAASGRLSFESTPPTMMVLVFITLTLAIVLGTGAVGRRLALGVPLVALVAIQGFRFPLELLMHRAYAEGVMPVQMSYSGRNFDIITGITAIIVAILLWRGVIGPGWVRVWNWMGIALLLNVLIVAILSAPLPFRRFMNEPANTWVTHPPFVWLPTVMVLTAVLGHVVIHRRLRHEARQTTSVT